MLCGQFVHYYAYHNDDGSLRQGAVARDVPIADGAQDESSLRLSRPPVAAPVEAAAAEHIDGPANSLALNMAQCLSISNLNQPAVEDIPQADPILYNGAPYSSIGYNDLCFLNVDLISN